MKQQQKPSAIILNWLGQRRLTFRSWLIRLSDGGLNFAASKSDKMIQKVSNQVLLAFIFINGLSLLYNIRYLSQYWHSPGMLEILRNMWLLSFLVEVSLVYLYWFKTTKQIHSGKLRQRYIALVFITFILAISYLLLISARLGHNYRAYTYLIGFLPLPFLFFAYKDKRFVWYSLGILVLSFCIGFYVTEIWWARILIPHRLADELFFELNLIEVFGLGFSLFTFWKNSQDLRESIASNT